MHNQGGSTTAAAQQQYELQQQQLMEAEHQHYSETAAKLMGRVAPLQQMHQQQHQQQMLHPMATLSPQMQSSSGPLLQAQESQQPNAAFQQQNNQNMVVHETFSIPMLERKMMFLNEPSLQYTQAGQATEQIRQLWRVHYQQMSNMREPDNGEQTLGQAKSTESIVPKRPDSLDEIGGQLGFSTPSQRPKDFNQFQNAVRNQLTELNRAHRDLRNRFKQAGSEVDKDILRIEQLTEHIQQVFNDFALCFNSFVQREERLETLHHQAIKKSKELSKKIQLEVMAQSSQRSQLLAIVDDLTNQLRETKATTVKTSALKSEHQAHQATRDLVEGKQKQIEALEQEIKALNGSLQQLGQSNEHHKVEKTQLEDQIGHLNGVIADLNSHIDDLIQRKSQLEQEVSRLKSQIELTQSSKDKIILKLKQEMRMNAVHQAAPVLPSVNLNGTQHQTLNNTSVVAGLSNNLSTANYQHLNNSQNNNALVSNAKQIHGSSFPPQPQGGQLQSLTASQQQIFQQQQFSRQGTGAGAKSALAENSKQQMQQTVVLGAGQATNPQNPNLFHSGAGQRQ